MKRLLVRVILLFCANIFGNSIYSYSIEDRFNEIELLINLDCYEEAMDSIHILSSFNLTQKHKNHFTYLKGEANLYLGKLNDAFNDYRNIYYKKKNEFTYLAVSRLAYLFYLSADYEKSLALINEIPKEKRIYRDILVLAKAYIELKDYSRAHKIYDKLILNDRRDYNYFLKANCFIKEGKYQDAINIYSRLIEHSKNINILYYNNLLYCINKIDAFSASRIYIEIDSFLINNDGVSNHRIGVYLQNKAEFLSRINCHAEASFYIDKAICTYFNVEDISDINLLNNRDKQSLLDFYEEKIEILSRAHSHELSQAYYYMHRIINQLKIEAIEDDIKFRKAIDYKDYYEKAFHYYISIADYESAYFFINQIKDSALDFGIMINSNEMSHQEEEIKELYEVQYKKESDIVLKNMLRVDALAAFNDSYDLVQNPDVNFLKAFQKTLNKEDLVLDYYVIDSITYVFIIDQNEFRFNEIGENIDLVNKLKSQLNSAPQIGEWTIEKQFEFKILSAEVYQSLIPENISDYKSLVVLPHQHIHGLAFEALVYKDQYLLNNNNVSYASSITLLNAIESRNYNSKENVLLTEARTYDLIGSVNESEYLIDNFGFIQSKELAKGNKTSIYANIIHMSNHSSLNSNRLETRFMLNESDCLKTRDLLCGKVKANLLVLAGCETGLGEEIEAEGIFGLSRSAFISGSKAVISSYHKINDEASHEIMNYFYDYLNKGLTTTVALTNAKKKYIEEQSIFYSHPYYWSGIVLEGSYKMKPLERYPRIASLFAFMN